MTVDWLYLPSVPFDVIMTKIAHDSLTTLRNCTEVCSTWNEMIEKGILKNPAVMDTLRDNKMEHAFGPQVRVNSFEFRPRNRLQLLPSNEEISNAKWLIGKNLLNIEVIEKFAVRVREWLHALDSLSLTICAASLAYHGLLGQAEKITCLCISNIDLTSVPNEHLAALASWMTSSCDVSINKTSTSGIGLTSFLNSLKCHDLWIHGDSHGMILGREETDALVQAMESSVKMVGLDSVTMDMKTLFMYNGEGRCCEVVLTRRDEDPVHVQRRGAVL